MYLELIGLNISSKFNYWIGEFKEKFFRVNLLYNVDELSKICL